MSALQYLVVIGVGALSGTATWIIISEVLYPSLGQWVRDNAKSLMPWMALLFTSLAILIGVMA